MSTVVKLDEIFPAHQSSLLPARFKAPENATCESLVKGTTK